VATFLYGEKSLSIDTPLLSKESGSYFYLSEKKMRARKNKVNARKKIEKNGYRKRALVERYHCHGFLKRSGYMPRSRARS